MRSIRGVVLATVGLSALACSVSVTTAHISDAKLAKDPDGSRPAVTFAPTDAFYCIATLSNAPDGTKVKAVWIAVAAAGVENHAIQEYEQESGSAEIRFSLEKDTPWPEGAYKVDLYLDGRLARTLPFSVEAAAGD